MSEQFTESIEVDIPEVPDDLSELGEAQEKPPYRTLLELWRALLGEVTITAARKDPISPQWAVKMVTTYPGVTFADVDQIHHGVFDLAAELSAYLDEEIAADDECLKKATPQEDAEQNARHYKDLLALWQGHILQAELAWRPSDDDAAVQLAILSEVQQMFLGEMGIVAHLEQIGFQFDDADREELAQHLAGIREVALGVSGE